MAFCGMHHKENMSVKFDANAVLKENDFGM